MIGLHTLAVVIGNDAVAMYELSQVSRSAQQSPDMSKQLQTSVESCALYKNANKSLLERKCDGQSFKLNYRCKLSPDFDTFS